MSGKKPGPSLPLSIGLIVVSTIVFCVALYILVRPIFGLLSGDPIPVPGRATEQYDEGVYDIYEQVFSFGGGFGRTSLRPEDVVVTGPDGIVATQRVSSISSLSRNGANYEAVLQFEAATDGDYTVDISGTDGWVVIGESFDTAWDGAAPWIIAAIVSSLTFLVGFVMLIVGMVRRRNHVDRSTGPPPSTAPPPSMAPPATMTPPVAPPAAPPSPTTGPSDVPW
ncbi:MAG: hypothetical protein EX269_12750 [Acidimicrobiales bacterium]|nr:MAG: hypothetical protein EX269_12750 [Acidimicrobiales bacterium]